VREQSVTKNPAISSPTAVDEGLPYVADVLTRRTAADISTDLRVENARKALVVVVVVWIIDERYSNPTSSGTAWRTITGVERRNCSPVGPIKSSAVKARIRGGRIADAGATARRLEAGGGGGGEQARGERDPTFRRDLLAASTLSRRFSASWRRRSRIRSADARKEITRNPAVLCTTLILSLVRRNALITIGIYEDFTRTAHPRIPARSVRLIPLCSPSAEPRIPPGITGAITGIFDRLIIAALSSRLLSCAFHSAARESDTSRSSDSA